MADRYATIVKQDDGTEVVSNIAQMEGQPPEIRSAAKDQVRVIKAKDGLKIGMIKGGEVDSVDGFGWPKGTPSQLPPKPEKTRTTDDAFDKERAEVSGSKK